MGTSGVSKYASAAHSLSSLDADEDELLSVEKVPIQEAIEMALSGEIVDAKSLAAFLLTKSHLEKYLG